MGNKGTKEVTTKHESGSGEVQKSKNNERYSDDPLKKPRMPPADPADDILKSVSPHAIQEALSQGKRIVRALYDYSSNVSPEGSDYPDLSFKKGDVMELIKEDGDWWLGRNILSQVMGYIPSTYVAPVNGLDQFDWYHGKISRKDAEKCLLGCGVRGAFLIRVSESATGSYSLSVLDVVQPTREKVLKHYRIRDLDEGGCYITTKQQFASLEELIQYYSGEADGLCCRLSQPCQKSKPEMWDLSRNMRDKWEIDRSELVFGKKLGSGQFGEVFKGMWNNTTEVAIKTLKEGAMEVEKFLEEAAIMKTLRHDKLVKLYAVCSTKEPIYIVTEFLCNGALLQYLREDKGSKLKWNELVDFASQVADGMKYIEANKYIHRDLAARNILVGRNNIIKIGDFGLARVISDDMYEAKQGSKFPIKWTAPEAAMYGRFTIKSDIWAYGILLVEIFTYGQIPYPGMSNSEVLMQLERGYRHPKPANCTPEMYDIMMACWKKEAEERPTFEYLNSVMDDFAVATQSGYHETNN